MDALPVRAGTLLIVALTVGLAAGGCASAGSPTPGSASLPVVSSASPTAAPAGPSASPGPDASTATGAPVGLVVRLTWCADVCIANPGTTVLEDGRVIWRTEDGDWVQRRLTADGLAQVHQRLDATGALGVSADFKPQVKPGPEPPGHGTTSYAFRLVRDGIPVVVNSGEPLEPEFWVNPPEMAVLAELARSLRDPVASLSADAWAGEAEAFFPPAYLLFVALRPDQDPPFDVAVDVDEVALPLPAPVEAVGAPFARDGDVSPNDRCMPVSADLADRIAAADAAAGRPRDLTMTLSELEYAWARRNGFVSIGLQWLMPDQAWGCTASLDW